MRSKVKKIFIGFFTTLVTVLLLLLSQTCSESPNSPNTEPFSFTVNAVDQLNRPISNLKVGVYFQLKEASNKNIHKVKMNSNYGNTTFSFSLEKICNAELSVYDLEGNIIETLISKKKYSAGIYSVQYITGDLFPGVYNCVLTVEDTLGHSVIFKDSVYAVLYHTDPAYNGIGFTKLDGTFNSNNKAIFPSLFNLPTLIETGIEGPEQIGSFSIGDSVTILLTDTVANQTFIYTRKLNEFSNDFILQFPPDAVDIQKLNTYHFSNKSLSHIQKEVKCNPGEWINSVDLEYFFAEVTEDIVTLKWKTNSELSNQGFEIQRKSSNPEFETIGFVYGMGTTNEPHTYLYTDDNLYVGDYNYRMKIIAIDGTFEYSDTLNVSVLQQYSFSLMQNYPNPFN